MEKNEAASLKALTESHGWKVLKKELEDEIAEIEALIFKVDGGENDVIKYTENNLLKRIRQMYKTLLEAPDELIESFGVEEIDDV